MVKYKNKNKNIPRDTTLKSEKDIKWELTV